MYVSASFYRIISRLALSLVIICIVGASQEVFSQTDPVSNYFPDIKIIESNSPAPGYYFLAVKGLTAPGAKYFIAIVDNYGTPVFFRLMPKASVSMRLLKDGTIGYVHGVPRKLYLMDEMLNITDTINTVGLKLDGHDWDVDDSGNYHRYVFAQYTRTVDMSVLVVGGNSAAEINETVIQEFDTDNNLLNSWYTEDLFDILDGNEESPFVDFTEASIDYAHLNSVAVFSDTSFVVSTRHMDEITNIDRRSGEIIWRLGGKNNQFTFINDTIGFTHQHCPRKLENGNLLLFDNGNLHDTQFSSAIEYELDEVNMTATLVRRFRRNPDVFAPRDGATQRVHNGNTLITWGPVWPGVTEFNPDGTIAFDMDTKEHSMSPRIEKYRWETKVFETSVDSVDFGTFDGTNPVVRTMQLTNNTDTIMHLTGYTTRSDNFSVESTLPLEMQPGVPTDIIISFEPQLTYQGYFNDVITLASDNESQRIARQVFLEGSQADNISPTMIIMPDSSNVPVSANIIIDFSEPVRISGGPEVDYSNVGDLIAFKKNSISGIEVASTASINTGKNKITIKPEVLLDSGQVYYVDISGVLEDYSGNALVSSPGTFNTAMATGIYDIGDLSDLSIYPNPSSGMVQFQMELNNPAYLIIYSSDGRIILNKTISSGFQHEFDLSGLGKGMYLMLIKSDSQGILGRGKIIIE